MNKQKVIQWGILVVSLVAIAIAGFTIIQTGYTYQGSLIDPPIRADDFELVNYDSTPFHLSDYRGKVVLLFFGYTNCPDVCPTTLYDFKRIAQALDESSGKVEYVFVTLDPERDTPERLRQYISAFNDSFWGLTGSEEQLSRIWSAYGVYREIEQVGDSAAGYLINHTARVYVIDKNGNLRLTFPFGMPYEAMVEDVQHLVKE